MGIQFRHEAGKDIHAPGYYLHLEAGACFAGVGLWHPETEVARTCGRRSTMTPTSGRRPPGSKIREDLDPRPGRRRDVEAGPAGLDPGHPYADDLRMRSFIAGTSLTQKQVTGAGFEQELATMFSMASRFTRFLCDALGLPF